MEADVHFELLWPEFLVAGLAFVIFTLDFFLRPERKNILAWVSVIGLAGILAFTIPYLLDENDSLFNGLYRIDDYALFFKVLSMAIGGTWSAPANTESRRATTASRSTSTLVGLAGLSR
mgnify:CR=1 FL=1